jgi:hypothetical protein
MSRIFGLGLVDFFILLGMIRVRGAATPQISSE